MEESNQMKEKMKLCEHWPRDGFVRLLSLNGAIADTQFSSYLIVLLQSARLCKALCRAKSKALGNS